ncbi:hypothetical protein JD505_17285 [Aeromonas hydrophila]|uniref:hypothetical protein n=1 Tax=Aeromonas hydrophila TaxID=644 RepID=UPI00191DACA0|nr:hypothetical protein [Aeromonas hydrophila]MBL0571003.1 hypothetical protein [Aeromonas hydrophila]
MTDFTFRVPPYVRYYPKLKGAVSVAYLEANNWDDFGFKSTFNLVVFDENGKEYNIGVVKIGYTGQDNGWTQSKLPKEFSTLDSSFFLLAKAMNIIKTFSL